VLGFSIGCASVSVSSMNLLYCKTERGALLDTWGENLESSEYRIEFIVQRLEVLVWYGVLE
jgi:hypothetical protein